MIQFMRSAYSLLFSFLVSVLCGMLAAFSLAVPAFAQASSGITAPGGLEFIGPGALISILCWLLQDSNKARVTEAKESTERVRLIYEGQLTRDRETQIEHRGYLDRVLAAYERLLPFPNSQKSPLDPP